MFVGKCLKYLNVPCFQWAWIFLWFCEETFFFAFWSLEYHIFEQKHFFYVLWFVVGRGTSPHCPPVSFMWVWKFRLSFSHVVEQVSHRHTFQYSWFCALFFCFLPFILFFFSVPQLSHLIWNFLNWSLAGSYLHVNALLWACFKLTSKLTRNWRVYILFKAEITSSQFSGSIGLSWKMSFCLLCCPWLNCIFCYGIQPW